jgi:histidyl-tRNA synthetase
MSFQAPKGVAEYQPPLAEAFLALREGLMTPSRSAGYAFIELPIFEDTALFARGLGASTDVVSKEMYTFEDRGGRSLSLRPDGTASTVRAVIEHGLDRVGLPVKLWYAGPFFRAERPQAGRYRQFTQVGIEAIGSEDPALDAEVVALAYQGLASVGVSDFTLNITSLGDQACRPKYRAILQDFLAGLDLDAATRARAEINPLRVLDDKRTEVQSQLTQAPLMVDHLCSDCSEHFTSVTGYLDALGIPYVISPSLVRGLDYYTRTTFEFVHHRLGAQSGIGGGGRYDGLMADLGGQELSGIGWAIGVDRVLLALESEEKKVSIPSLDVFVVPIGEQARERALSLAMAIRAAGLSADLVFGERGVKGAMKAADRSGARWAVVLGDSELASGTATLKDLESGAQESVSLTDIADEIKKRLM